MPVPWLLRLRKGHVSVLFKEDWRLVDVTLPARY